MRLIIFIIALVAFAATAHAFDCAGVTLPSSLVICSDPELMRLADQRHQAFNNALWGLAPEEYKRLMADQNVWVRSYSTACGVPPDRPAPTPVPPAVRECFANAGKARIAYLRAYRQSVAQASLPGPAPGAAPASPDHIGPSFNCSAARQPLALMLCADPQLSLTDFRFGQAYYALLQSLNSQGQVELKEEDHEFIEDIHDKCGISHDGVLSDETWRGRECVKAAYEAETTTWVGRLSGAGYQEAMRPPEQQIALQRVLQEVGFLPQSSAIDGVYGPTTRMAITAWQTARGRAPTGLLGEDDAQALTAEITPSSDQPPRAPLAPMERGPTAPITSLLGAEVALRDEGGTYGVPVRINNALTLNFTLDSGASDVLIPADVVLTLIRTETLSQSDFIGQKSYRLADGSELPSMTFTLQELRVGDHILHNVRASVGPVDGGLLLGQSFLSRFKSWTLDNDRHVLVLVER
jgi:uncharacterized protein/predicted aspartyl protease